MQPRRPPLARGFLVPVPAFLCRRLQPDGDLGRRPIVPAWRITTSAGALVCLQHRTPLYLLTYARICPEGLVDGSQ